MYVAIAWKCSLQYDTVGCTMLVHHLHDFIWFFCVPWSCPVWGEHCDQVTPNLLPSSQHKCVQGNPSTAIQALVWSCKLKTLLSFKTDSGWQNWTISCHSQYNWMYHFLHLYSKWHRTSHQLDQSSCLPGMRSKYTGVSSILPIKALGNLPFFPPSAHYADGQKDLFSTVVYVNLWIALVCLVNDSSSSCTDHKSSV